jgi:hypothetical protein
MCQDVISRDFTRRPAPRGVSPSVLLCVVLAAGAAFGTAAHTALHYLGLDFASIHNDLIAGHAAKARSAIAWWSWCAVVPAAFFVGPLSAALTRTVVAKAWRTKAWRMRAPRPWVTPAAVLGLAVITTTAALGLLVVAASMLLAALGAQVLGSFSTTAGPARMLVADGNFAPLPVAPSWRGGGSAVAGLPFPRLREPHPLAPGRSSVRRLARIAVLALVVLAAISALGGATVLLATVAPGQVRALVASWLPAVGAADRARTLVLALLPVEPPTRVVMPPVALLDAPPPKPVEAPKPVEPPKAVEPPKPVEPPEPRQRAIAVSASHGGVEPSESELTFTKGYSRRRAAQLVATVTSLPSIPQLTAAIDIKKIRAASLLFTQGDRANRTVAENPADNRLADKGSRTSRHARGHNRYVDRQDRYFDYNTYYDRRGRRDRRGARDRYGDGRFAGAEWAYRPF